MNMTRNKSAKENKPIYTKSPVEFLSLGLATVILLVACSSQAATAQSDLQAQEADAIKKVIAGIDAA